MVTYPQTRRTDLVETVHGTQVPDPYRWLEDADSPEVAAWAAAQQALTESEVAGYPERAWFARTMSQVVSRPRAGVPLRESGRWFVSRNDGVRAQAVWYMADSLAGLEAGGEVVLDPNTWSEDGTASLSTFSVSGDGRHLAYAISEGGSDWQQVRVKDLATGEDLPDRVVAKFSDLTWLPDHRSFLYGTFDEADDARGTATQGLGVQRVVRHTLGGADEEVAAGSEPTVFLGPWVSHDHRWLVLSVSRGTELTNELWVAPLTAGEAGTVIGDWVEMEPEARAAWDVVRSLGDELLIVTDDAAPLRRVVRRAVAPGSDPVEVVPEGEWPIETVVPHGEELLVVTLEDAVTRVDRYGLDGAHRGRVTLPDGALVDVHGEVEGEEATLGLSTLAAPCQAYGIGRDGQARELGLVSDAGAPLLDLGGLDVTRERATSADGTSVPYFLVRPAGAQGPLPTILYGYGGFGVPVQLDHRAGWVAWLRAGGALAVANLRGGSELGRDWYEAGRLTHKQNVFDDFIACAEHLCASGATTREQLALHGRSNGGLLVGAVMTQRPDLAAVALPAVGVLDLLRFHKFTVGAAWISDYGDPDLAEDFAVARAYSPLHNVCDGERYPATLVCTADHDDRVVPLHSLKFAAALQHAQAGDAPILLRVETSAGHGVGKSNEMIAAEWADVLTFAAHHMGLVVGD